jgi:hypothetical protein
MSAKVTAIALWAKMAALVTLAILLLAVCSRDNPAADIKQCIAEVQRTASQGRLDQVYHFPKADSAEERHDQIGAAVSDCMEKAGYRHENADMTDARCVYDVSFNPYCYRRGN